MGENKLLKSAIKQTKTQTDIKSASNCQPVKLTTKQKKFCKYLASGYNATQAAKKAGYSAKTARQMGCENLTKPYILEIAKKDALKDQENFNYTKQNHFTELIEAEQLAKNTGDVKAFLNAIVQKGKLFGLYIEKQEVTVKEPRKFVVEIVKPK